MLIILSTIARVIGLIQRAEQYADILHSDRVMLEGEYEFLQGQAERADLDTFAVMVIRTEMDLCAERIAETKAEQLEVGIELNRLYAEYADAAGHTGETL